jgi:hypothetical protein
MEMIGLVLIVVIILIGVILYATASGRKDVSKNNKETVEKQKSPTFLTALATTDMQQCSNRPVQEVIAKCIRGERYCENGDACGTAQEFIQAVTDTTLQSQGVKYDLYIKDNADVIRANDRCDSIGNRSALTYAGKTYPIELGTGDTVLMVLFICK